MSRKHSSQRKKKGPILSRREREKAAINRSREEQLAVREVESQNGSVDLEEGKEVFVSSFIGGTGSMEALQPVLIQEGDEGKFIKGPIKKEMRIVVNLLLTREGEDPELLEAFGALPPTQRFDAVREMIQRWHPHTKER